MHRVIPIKVIFLGLFSFYCQESIGANFFNITATGPNLTVNSNVPNHTYTNAGIKIDTTNFSFTSPETTCTASNEEYCLFSIRSGVAKTIPITGLGSFNVTTCLNGNGPVSCERSTIGERYAYITDGSSASTVTVCSRNSDTGALSNCANTGSDFSAPLSVAINRKKNYAYVNSFSEDHSITICSLVPQDGTLTDCRQTGNIFETKFITLNSTDTFAYASGYTVIGNVVNHVVYLCSIDSQSGDLNNCAPTGSGFAGAGGIAINPSGTRLYVTNNLSNNVSMCSISQETGALSNCVTTGNGSFTAPWRITLNTLGTLAYITTDANSDITVCSIDKKTGYFNNCTLTGYGTFGGSGNIAISLNNKFAYIPNSDNDIVSICSVDQVNGNLIDCVNSGINVPNSVGMALL